MLPPLLASLLEPLRFIALALSYLPSTILAAVLTLDLGTLLSPSRLQSAWFARFWARAGPEVRQNAEKNVLPLLHGRVARGVVPPLAETSNSATPHPPVGGTVLEIGPGSGMWTSAFSPASLPGIARVYGVEPNAGVHGALRQRIAAAGLSDTYEIVPVGVEDLAKSGVQPGSADCIVTVMCLCSIPDPHRNVALLYDYLKPGGRWYVYEHVRCFRGQGLGMRLYQAFLNLFWPHIFGGCEMRRDTEKYLREAGPWSDADVHPLQGEPWFYTMPHIIGVLTK